MISPKKYRQVTSRSCNFLFFDFRPAMLRKNLARYFLLMRHVFTYTPALFSHKHKTWTNKFDFLSLPDLDRWLSVIYFFESFEVFTQVETIINCLKPGQKQGAWGALTVHIKISLCSIHNTVVCGKDMEVFTYLYSRWNMSVYF